MTDNIVETLAERYLALGKEVLSGIEDFDVRITGGDGPSGRNTVNSNSYALAQFLRTAFEVAQHAAYAHLQGLKPHRSMTRLF